MKRSGWVTGVVVAQFLCGTLFFLTCIVLLLLLPQPVMKQGGDAASAAQGLRLAASILAPLTVLVFAGAWGLAKNTLWGWWLAFLMDAALLGIFVYSMVDDGLSNPDWGMFGFTALALLLVLWLLVPAVRRFYWRDGLKAAKVGSQ